MDCNCKGHPLNCSKHPNDCGCNAGLTAESILTQEQFEAIAIGSALAPIIKKLPPLTPQQWHRFSFDVVRLNDDLRVNHVRLVAIKSAPHVEDPREVLMQGLLEQAEQFIAGFAASTESGFVRRRAALQWLASYRKVASMPKR